jgi:tRNA uridine 5-carboxymethylaminomethyl modification enzyme
VEASATHLAPWIESEIGSKLVLGVLATIETELKYAGYIEQQERQIGRLRDAERRPIPKSFEFASVPGLSREIREKLQRVSPATLGQAARIPGVTPAAVAVLDIYLSLASRNQGEFERDFLKGSLAGSNFPGERN